MNGDRTRAPAGWRCTTLAATVWLAFALFAPEAAWAQTDLGGQRVGTSSGEFLKIPFDARGAAMASATCSYITGPAALFWNPAGLGLERRKAVLVSGIDYPAGIPMGAAVVSLPWGPLRGNIAFGLAAMSVSMDETDEFHPLGTGRDFTCSNWTITAGASRSFTDRLSFGLSVKVFHEALGTEVGGPSTTSWLLDAGAIYFVGFREARIGIALTGFGPDLRPGGSFTSHRSGAEIRYTSFSPPTFFRFGASVDPYTRGPWKTLASVEVGHPADNQEVLRAGGEVSFQEMLAVRAGYDFSADALKLHAGLGARVRMGESLFHLDYAYSDGGYFGGVHRWTLRYIW